MTISQSMGNCGYSVLSTAGTTTLNPGQAAGRATTFAVLYGAATLDAGSSFAYSIYDIVPQIGATPATTNTLMNGTNSAGSVQAAGLGGVGVRVKGALVAVTAGTPGKINVLWDA